MNKNELKLSIKGMHCAACSSRIERVIGNMESVDAISVSLASNTANIKFKNTTNSSKLVDDICTKIGNLGFDANIISGDSSNASASAISERFEKNNQEAELELVKRKKELIPTIILAGLLLILSMGEMVGLNLPKLLNPKFNPLNFALAQFILCAPILWIGKGFYVKGIPALFRGAPTMDSLVAIGTGAAFLYSIIQTMALLPLNNNFFADISRPYNFDLGTMSSFEMLKHFLFDMPEHGTELYYESAGIVVALVSLGKYFESKSKMQTARVITSLLELSPEQATKILLNNIELKENGEINANLFNVDQAIVPLSEVNVNDVLFVKPGDRVPLDGVIVKGASYVDESMLTGESIPVEKRIKDFVTGGTINQQGSFYMQAKHVGSDTVLARILNMVEEAQGSKAPIASLADKISFYFVPVVICIAVLSGLFWFLETGSISYSLRFFISVLVIACPCAMGLATPMSIMVGSGRGALMGVLFKNGTALEQTAHIKTIVFDKTGTLTKGKPTLSNITLVNSTYMEEWLKSFDEIVKNIMSNEDDYAESKIERTTNLYLKFAASIETHSEHPLAKAIVDSAKSKNIKLLDAKNTKEITGKGICGNITFANSEYEILVGKLDYLQEHNVQMDLNDLNENLKIEAKLGKTPVFLSIDGKLAAFLAISDPIREEVPFVISKLKESNINSIMLTGDNQITANAIAKKAGILEVISEVLPEQKGEVIKELKNKNLSIGMVGDGVNDAPALALADVGFAMASGIDVAVETSDVVLIRPSMLSLLNALNIGKLTMRNIKENLFWAFSYNIVGIPFAAGVFHYFNGPALSPMLAGAAMAFSSVSVVANALRLRFIKEIKMN